MLLVLVLTGAVGVGTASGAGGTPASQAADSVPGIPGLPTGVPPAATAPEPVLPEPERSEWPFPSDFSHTSGTGLLAGGASLWSDFVYDDHGPLGNPKGIEEGSNVTSLAPVHGGFVYPEGPADKNGADIFTAAIGYSASEESTYWRVDWNTLANKDVPIAEWTFSTGASTPVSGDAWPANAGVRSAGIQYALVVSAQHAQLLDAVTGLPVAGANLETDVDMAAKSFIVRIPTSVLPVSGSWKVRLAAGLANAGGTAFETVGPQDGGTAGANVYNVDFRSYEEERPRVCPSKDLTDLEPVAGAERELGAEGEEEDTNSTPAKHVPVAECGNFWMENDQANTLASGDVSKYSLSINWSQLAAKDETAEPKPTGYSNRWYVSPLKLGEGVIKSQGSYTGPTYLGQVQPYAVYVPTNYDPSKPTPLSWILHSLSSNFNQYGGIAPSQLAEECQDRASICATTEGFSNGQWYFQQAQVDFWDVWHALASSYDLDPDKTVISGYSMGGFASYKLALEYPDLFAQSMPLEGPVLCGGRVIGSLESTDGPGQCEHASNTKALIVNAKWIPYVIAYAAADELVQFPGGVEQIEEFDKLNYRYYALLYANGDHVAFSAENNFAPAISQLGQLERVKDPASFTFTWFPEVDEIAKLGIGPTSDYWISGLQAASANPGQRATVSAHSQALPEPEETIERQTGTATGGPTPAATKSLTWTPGPSSALAQTLTLGLTDVAALSVDTVAAGLKCATVTTTSDGPTAFTLLHLSPGSSVSENGATVAIAPGSGTATVELPDGTSTVGLCSAAAQSAELTAQSGGSGTGSPSSSGGASAANGGHAQTGSGAHGAHAKKSRKRHKKATSKRCTSQRKFPIHIQNIRELEIVSAQIYLNHRLHTTVRLPHLSTVVNLKGLPKGTFVVNITAHQRDGHVLHYQRIYHTCSSVRPSPRHLYLRAAFG